MRSGAKSILIGGLACAVLSVVFQVGIALVDSTGTNPALGITANCLARLEGLTSGLISVWHYARHNEVALSQGEGIKMGARAGVVSVMAGFLNSRILMLMEGMLTA